MIKRLIFDIDGTLITGVNFQPYIEKAFKNYRINDPKKVKIFLSNIKEYEQTIKTYDRSKFLRFFSEKLNEDLQYDFFDTLFNELQNAVPNDPNEIIAIKEMLLRFPGYEKVLLTNFIAESQKRRLKTMGINNFFSECHGEKVTKPNKLAFDMARGNFKPWECIMIGDDREMDIAPAKKLGFHTIHVNKEGEGDITSLASLTPELLHRLIRKR